MQDIFIYIKDNVDWIFSGIGVFCLGLLIRYFGGKIKKILNPVDKIENMHAQNKIYINKGQEVIVIRDINNIYNDIKSGKVGRDNNMLSDLQNEILEKIIEGNDTVDKISTEIGVTNKMARNLIGGMVNHGIVSLNGDKLSVQIKQKNE